MESNEIYNKLKERALKFHQVLTQNDIYNSDVSENEFLQRAENTLKRTASEIVDETGDPWVAVLALPEALIGDLSDKVYTSTCDTMDGPRTLFDAIDELLSQTQFKFSWHFDKVAGKLSFQIDEITWFTSCSSLSEISEDPFGYSQLSPKLNDYLMTHGMEFYSIGTPDTFVRFMLVPATAIEAIKDYLIYAFDERVAWFFEGIPEDERPDELWLL